MEKEAIIKKVKNVLTQIEPYLKADGGGVEFVNLDDDMVVWVKLTGHCANCPHSSQTLKNGIENTMKSVIPEIKAVEKINFK
ncbi:MAG: NifU family protein [Bacteroidales bacterium]|nr:NifU family protein [Bacteroidales bacterium]